MNSIKKIKKWNAYAQVIKVWYFSIYFRIFNNIFKKLYLKNNFPLTLSQLLVSNIISQVGTFERISCFKWIVDATKFVFGTVRHRF